MASLFLSVHTHFFAYEVEAALVVDFVMCMFIAGDVLHFALYSLRLSASSTLLGIMIGMDQLDSYSVGVIWGVEVVNAVKSQGHAVPRVSQLLLTSGEFCVDLSAQLGTSFMPFTGTYLRERLR